MREGHASFTAAAVSAARGIAGVDPIAESLASGPLAALVRAARGDLARSVVNAATLGLIDHAELRTLAIDAAVRDAVDAGVRQVVLLGAGLDARAWRMPELAEARVLEVDHPATQAAKRARVAGRRAEAREVRFVPIDFERESLAEVLARGGHDGESPTLWIWEGVTPYLGIDAVRATLAAVGARSAAGSRLAITYATPEALTAGTALVRVARLGFRAIGEELRGLVPTSVMHDELAWVDLRVVDDTSPTEWAERYGGGRGRLLLVVERLAVAVREG